MQRDIQQPSGWLKSSYCDNHNDACVEVSFTERGVHVRDSKDSAIPSAAISKSGWMAFLDHIAARR
ncbi:DUF397 domain-containing protein [Streptomyces sp. NPDC096176]|uniref:DUF397 domain-containing protein n=1 Tax=Streptomyces sp. NPDC096176 TaxID=3366079 RepID=UPI0037F53D7D